MSMENEFTKEEISAAKLTKAEILNPDTPSELKAVYMAGEICMWDELTNAPSPPTPGGVGKDEILEIIKDESEKSNVRKYTCINGMGYSQFERNIADRVIALYLSLPPASGIDGKDVEGSFEQFMTNSRNEFVKAVTEDFPHEKYYVDERAVRMRVAAENILICFDQMKERLSTSGQGESVEFVKWIHNNGYRTAGWDDGQLERIYQLFKQQLPSPADTEK